MFKVNETIQNESLEHSDSNIFIKSFDIVHSIVFSRFKNYITKKMPDVVYKTLKYFYDAELSYDNTWNKVCDDIYVVSGVSFDKDKKYCFDIINLSTVSGNSKYSNKKLVIYEDILMEASKDIESYLYQLRKLFSAIILFLDDDKIEDRYFILSDSPSEFEFSMAPIILAIKFIYYVMDGDIDKEKFKNITGLYEQSIDIATSNTLYELFIDHTICKIK